MRYAAGGGLTPEGRARREQVRLEAAALFEQGLSRPAVARRLRVSAVSAWRWHRAWERGGEAALASKGPGGDPCRLDDRQLGQLEAELRRGPAAHGYDDQCWTGARVAEVIEKRFGVHYTARGAAMLMRRMDWSPQRPARRAARRDEEEVARRREQTWAQIREKLRREGGWVCFEDEDGHTLRPPRGRTWGRRGRTPVVHVCGGGSGKVSAAGIVCAKKGRDTRLVYRTRVHTYRRGERRSLSEEDYADLLTAAHEQLLAASGGDERAARMILVWDNLNTHTSPDMRAFLEANAKWLTVYRLPPYAPDLNPAEGVWGNLKHGLRDLVAVAPAPLRHLAGAVEAGLARIAARPALLDGFIAETGLAVTLSAGRPRPPRRPAGCGAGGGAAGRPPPARRRASPASPGPSTPRPRRCGAAPPPCAHPAGPPPRHHPRGTPARSLLTGPRP